MKKYSGFFIAISLICLVLIFTACGPSSTTVTTLHLQDAVATGPINQPPIHLTESRETPAFTISPWFSYNSQKENNAYISGHTPVNADGIFQVDTVFHSNGTVSYHQAVAANIYEYEGKNLAWDIASFSGGLNLDARLSKAFAIFLGFSYATTNSIDTWGGSSGISFIVEKENLAFRLDAGLHVQAIAYDAHTVAIVQTYSSSGTYEYVLFYHDVGKESYWNPFISLTFNTASKNQLINFFINAGYSFQTLIDFEPQDFDNQYYYWWTPFDDYHREVVEDLRGSSTAGYLNFTPGVYFRLGESSLISAGVRFFIETQLEDATTTTFILPMLQADFMF